MNKQAKIIIFSLTSLIGILSFFYPIFLFIGIFSILIIYYLSMKNLFSFKYILSLVIIFILSFANTSLHLKYYDDLSSLDENNVLIEARVLSIPTNNIENKTKFYAKVYKVSALNYKKENINAKTLVTINDTQEKLNKIKVGDTLSLKGKLKKPNTAQNPSQFDYSRYLRFKNTFSILYVQNEWEIIAHANDLKGKILRKLNDTRNRILAIHKQNIKSPMIEVLGGVIFGDDAVNPDEETKDNFTKSGIFHILAASGMNVTLIFGIWFFFAQNLKVPYRFSILTGMLLIFVYTCMTGFGPPIIRAFLMLSLILIGKLIDKKTSTTSLLFIVGFLMLLFNPLMIFDIGFQLSFIVTFALILTTPLLTFNFKSKQINYITGACLIPIIAQIYAAPLQMYYFNTFALYSVFANIAIIPVLSIVSFVGFLSSILALIPLISIKICFIADIILNPLLIYIVKVAELFAELPNAIINTKQPTIIQLYLYFSIIIFITCTIKFKLFHKKYIYCILSFITLFVFTLIPIINKESEIIFFAVGNADSILIKSPENKYFLLDTGKAPYLNSTSQANYIMIKYLKDKGIKNLEGLILSHYDSDHAGGTIDILRNVQVKNIFLSDIKEDTNLSSNIQNYIKEKNLKHTTIENETTIYRENNFLIKATKAKGENIQTENDNSLVVVVKSNNQKVLLMGDGSQNTYSSLPQDYKENLALIKIGHHGAQNTLNREMINNSDSFVISTGTNIYNHPSPDTIKLLTENKKTYSRTDFHNAIKVTIKGNKVQTQHYSPNKKKFIKITK